MESSAKVQCIFTINYFRKKLHHRYLSGSPMYVSEANTIKVFSYLSTNQIFDIYLVRTSIFVLIP